MKALVTSFGSATVPGGDAWWGKGTFESRAERSLERSGQEKHGRQAGLAPPWAAPATWAIAATRVTLTTEVLLPATGPTDSHRSHNSHGPHCQPQKSHAISHGSH